MKFWIITWFPNDGREVRRTSMGTLEQVVTQATHGISTGDIRKAKVKVINRGQVRA